MVEGEEGAAFVNSIILNRNFAKLAQLWISGVEVDWSKLYRDSKPCRISLPCYPFARERYWISSGTNTSRPSKPNHPFATEREKKDVQGEKFFQPVWHLSSLKNSSRQPQTDFGPLLLFDSNNQLRDELKLKIEERTLGEQSRMQPRSTGSKGIPLILVKPGRRFRKLDAQTYSLHPAAETDFHHLIEKLRKQKQLPRCVVYLASWQRHMEGETPTKALQESTIYPIVFLLQSLMKQQEDQTMKLLYGYTHGLDERYPYDAAVAGLLKTIEVEDRRFKWKSVEWNSNEDRDGVLVSKVEQIFAELQDENSDNHEVCYRGKLRWVKRVELVDLAKEYPSIPPADRLERIKKKGVYLITGGLGGLGLLFGQKLAEQYQANLILCGRRALTPEGDQHLTELKKSGAEVIYIQADISQPQDVKRLLKEVSERFGGLDGIIHSAGLLRDGWIRDKKREDIEAVLAPKVDGTVLLDEATAKMPLDFFVLFSSMSSIKGNIGQSDYAYANSFLDQFAWWREKQRTGGRRQGQTISINWPLWEEGGMQLEGERAELLVKQTGIIPLKTETGWQAFLQGLAASKTQFMALEKGTDLGESSGKDPKKKRLPVKDPENVDTILEKMVSEVTGIRGKKLDRDTRWEELGMDSILSMKLLQAIEEQFGLRLYPNELMEKDTLSKLTGYVKAEIGRASAIEAPKGKQPQTAKTQRPLIYLLSTPRAGSTLLRVMLMGHSEIFAPPELHLLPFKNLQERAELLEKGNQGYLREGLIETIKELEGLSIDEANQRMKELEQQKLSVQAIYQRLKELARGRYIVDKSPTYGTDPKILQRAEQMSSDVFYIYLVRHPLSVIESFERNRFDKLMGIKEDPWKFAENMWLRMNTNIQNFLGTVPRERWIRIRYEDLVKAPEKKMKELCSFLNLAFTKDMLNPYEGERIEGGLHKETSLSIGDPNFTKHKRIEAGFADAWKRQLDKVNRLSVESKQLARKYGYAFSVTKSYGLAPAQKSFMNRFGSGIQGGILYSILPSRWISA